jgi:hypothetical protein
LTIQQDIPFSHFSIEEERQSFGAFIIAKVGNRLRLICPPETSPTAQGVSPFKVVHSSITETESMEKFRPSVFRLKGRKSRHQLQINREN